MKLKARFGLNPLTIFNFCPAQMLFFSKKNDIYNNIPIFEFHYFCKTGLFFLNICV